MVVVVVVHSSTSHCTWIPQCWGYLLLLLRVLSVPWGSMGLQVMVAAGVPVVLSVVLLLATTRAIRDPSCVCHYRRMLLPRERLLEKPWNQWIESKGNEKKVNVGVCRVMVVVMVVDGI
jgi:hypothetical protein